MSSPRELPIVIIRSMSAKKKLFYTTLIAFQFTCNAIAGELTGAANLHEDAQIARAQNRPIITLISSRTCEYCEAVKRSDFQFMTEDDRFILREVNIDNPQPLIDFEGTSLSHRDFAKKYVKVFTPTVLFLNADGDQLADPLVGVSSLDYYSHYLEKRIDQSLKQLANVN